MSPTRRTPVALRTLSLYTRPGCHLCEQMKAVIARVARRRPLALVEVDISTDPGLERRYAHDIPVLLIGGLEIARHRIDEQQLLSVLDRDQLE